MDLNKKIILDAITVIECMEKIIIRLHNENSQLKDKLLSDRPELIVSEDLRHMMKIIENARKMGILDKIS